MEPRCCADCGRALTDEEMQMGVTTCRACQGTANEGPPVPTQERDMVGAGRYFLSFFLAGFIGLGLSYFLRFRGWLATWISLGVFATTTAIVVVVVLVAALEAKSEEEAFVEKFDDVAIDLDAGYSLPISRAALQLETDCSMVDPDPTIRDCDQFIDTLADTDLSLIAAIERLKSLKQEIPGSAPEEIEQLMTDIIQALELEHESNLVLIEGWSNLDSAKWQEGWDLSLEAALAGLDVAEAALRIGEELEE